jgi:CBS domain containing-hemolysin-like protein
MVLLVPIVILLLLVLGSAFFAGGELALMALDPIRLETLARRGSRLAELQQKLRGAPQRILSTILLCNNLINITFATIAAALALKHLAPIHGVGEKQALVVSTVASTLLLVMFGELLPKTIAAINPARLAAIVTYPLFLIDILLTPFNWLVAMVLMPLVRSLSGGRSTPQHRTSAEDVGTALALAYASGQLSHTDAAVAREALRFSQKDLADVMTPRVDVVAVPETASVGEALTQMTHTGFSRLPVYRENLDEITGVLMLKDLVRASLSAASAGHDPEDRWAQEPCLPHARQPAYFPLTKSIVESLAEMRRVRVHLAVVVDEHGGTAGVVSLEDILEELVGDIRDETDADHSADVIRRGPGFVIATGRTRLDSLPEFAAVQLGDSAAVTLGGLMMERLGRAVVVGDAIAVDGLTVTALKVMRNRIKLLRVEQVAAP